MAKKPEPLSFDQLLKGLESSNLKMNASIQAQLKSIQEQEHLAKMDEKLQIIQTIESVKSEKDETDLKEELKKGLLDTSGSGLNSNVLKLTNHIIDSNKSFKDFAIVATTHYKKLKDKKQDLSEADIEQQKAQDEQLQILKNIEKNTVPKKEKEKDLEIGGIGGWLTALAAALGATVGYFTAHIKLLKGLTAGLYKGLISLSDFFPSFKKVLFNIEMNFAMAGEYIKTVFKSFGSKVATIFESSAESLKKLFTFSKDSFIGKSVALIKSGLTGLSNFFAPIGEAFSDIKKFSTPIGNLFKSIGSGVTSFFEFFSGIGKSLSAFGKVFSAIKIIAEKIAIPITIIMGLYDGINEAIEGFKKEGILGGIKGFITGVLNSVIGSFFDLIKDIVSWVAGALGFDEVEKFLDSFSFTGIIKDFIDTIFAPIELIKDIFTKISDFVSSFKIPEFEIFGMKFGGGEEKAKIPVPVSNTPKTETVSGTLKGVTGDQIKSHPNYKKYYSESMKDYNDPVIAREDATDRVREDMVSEQSAKVKPVTPTAGNKVYGESAKVDAANKQPVAAQKQSTVISAPTQVNNSTQNASFKTPVRNQDNTVNSYLKSRYVA
jgi:hypothetical protein